MNDRTTQIGSWLLLGTILVWFIAQLAGSELFGNNWSFRHWPVTGLWYAGLWLVLLVAACRFSPSLIDRIATIISDRRRILIALGIVLLATLVFQFDSFFHGGGNMRVAQISQTHRIIIQWFEAGAIAVVASLYWVISLVWNSPDHAAGLAWRLTAFGSTAASLIAAAQIAGLLNRDRGRQILLFVILFFGPQALLMFGFIGVEPGIVAFTLWSAFFGLKYISKGRSRNLLLVWAVVLAAVVYHYSGLYLVPMAFFLTLPGRARSHATLVIGTAIGILSVAGLVYLFYWYGGSSLAFSQQVMPLNGRPPMLEYSLFSVLRWSDILQLFFLIAPMAIAAKLLSISKGVFKSRRVEIMMAHTMAVSGAIYVIVLYPVNSFVLDLPRLAAFVAPFGILLAIVLAEDRSDKSSVKDLGWRHPLLLGAVFSLFLLAGYGPVYLDLDKSSDFACEYFDKHDNYHRAGGMALRDAYFYDGRYTEAEEREALINVKSPDWLNIRGCSDLLRAGQFNDAITVLRQIVARNPYWSEPRELIGSAYLDMGRPELAKPHLDTALLIGPYRKPAHMNAYNYFGTQGQPVPALLLIEKSLKLFPDDDDIMVDQMLMLYRVKDYEKTDSLADYLIAKNDRLSYPHLVKGYLAEVAGDPAAAIEHYKTFVTIDPEGPDAPRVMQRIEMLRTQ